MSVSDGRSPNPLLSLGKLRMYILYGNDLRLYSHCLQQASAQNELNRHTLDKKDEHMNELA